MSTYPWTKRRTTVFILSLTKVGNVLTKFGSWDFFADQIQKWWRRITLDHSTDWLTFGSKQIKKHQRNKSNPINRKKKTCSTFSFLMLLFTLYIFLFYGAGANWCWWCMDFIMRIDAEICRASFKSTFLSAAFNYLLYFLHSYPDVMDHIVSVVEWECFNKNSIELIHPSLMPFLLHFFYGFYVVCFFVLCRSLFDFVFDSECSFCFRMQLMALHWEDFLIKDLLVRLMLKQLLHSFL